MILAMIFGIIAGVLTTETIYYEKCKKQDFKTPVCETSKLLEENKAK